MIRFKSLLFLVFFRLASGQNASIHPDTFLSTTELVEKYGYPCEVHEVATEDGYLLTMYRIPHGKNDTRVNDKPIIMMHGLFGTAENYIVSAMKNSCMAFYFADRGYDVWLGNARGTLHCKKHKTLDPKQPKFWKFSWHEIGVYDMSAMIDFILKTSGKKRLNYIGHSQGGTVFYVLNSMRPEYQDKIIQASLLAPAGLMVHFNNPLILPLAKNYKRLTKLAHDSKLYELPPPWINVSQLLLETCFQPMFKGLCQNIINSMSGGDSNEVDSEEYPLLVKYISTASSFQPLHYAQGIMSGRFRQWDFGEKKNLQVYGTAEPPDYPIENIKIPIAIYYSDGDNLVNPQDVIDICKRLPRCTRLYKMKNPKWTHFDFAISKNLVKELHEPLMSYMQSFDDKV